jgi:hypothetical protein
MTQYMGVRIHYESPPHLSLCRCGASTAFVPGLMVKRLL